MIILDSNVWIAYLSKLDSQHKKAQKIFEDLREKIALPEYLVLEICSVLALRVSKKSANNFLDFVLNNNDLEIILSDGELFLGSMTIFQKIKDGKLSFVDCSLVYLSKFHKVITLDRMLEKVLNRTKC